MFICGRGKEEYLMSESAIPEKTDPDFKKWNIENHMIMAWLINSMTMEIGENFLLYETALEMWQAARETYSSSDNTSELFAVESVLYDLRQGDQPVTLYYNALVRQWQQLDAFESHEWKCAEDGQRFLKIQEQKRTFKFLLGLNKDLDEVRGRIMGGKPLMNLREAFAEVRREESRKRVMMGTQNNSVNVEGSALASYGAHPASQQDTRSQRKTRPYCDHGAKPGHTKDTCWKIHGKPADWKPSRPFNERTDWKPSRPFNERNSRANSATSTEVTSFSKEQIEALQKALATTLTHHDTTSQPVSLQANKGIGIEEDDRQC
ncbi:uncharacterized protein [Primulina eburnea]|uniref:uncharacterized protein n=1 Tax=Primulina eburnea TaxID=1245227 RepID=UPI003C6C26C6